MTIKRTDINGINPSGISTVFEGAVAKPETGASTSTTSPAIKDNFETKGPTSKVLNSTASLWTGTNRFADTAKSALKSVRDADFPSQISTYLQPDQAVFDLFNDILDQGILSGAENLVQSAQTKASDAVSDIRSTASEVVADISGGFGNLFIDILAAGERVASGKSE